MLRTSAAGVGRVAGVGKAAGVGKVATMNRNTIYGIAGGAVLVLVIAIGLFFYLGRPANRGVPPLPANARMFNTWALIGCQVGANDGPCVLLRRAVNQQTQRVIL